MYFSIYTECKGNFALHPGSIAAMLKGNDSYTNQDLTGTDDGKDLVSPNGTNELVDYFVFQDKNHAIEFMENFPIAHLQNFNDINKARAFVILGPEYMPSVQSLDCLEPSLGDLDSLRKCIKGGECENVKSMISNNPKILISFGGIPTNLYSNFNYNAVHICAQYNQPKIAELILHTICSRHFVSLYLDRMNVTSYAELSQNFLEVFLNTPDDIQGETPLHIAAKFGHVEVVKVLTLFSACKLKTNIDGKLPMDIICKFARDSTMDIFRNIKQLIMKCYQDTGDDLNSEDKENVPPDDDAPSYNYRKRLSTLSLDSPLAPGEDRNTSKKARRSLFSSKSEDTICIESSDQDSPRLNPDVDQHDFEMINLSSTRLKLSKNTSVSHTMTSQMMSKYETSSSDQLDLSSDKNNTFNISSTSRCPNPWRCIESSLQENIKLIAMLIIEKLKDMSLSNNLLLVEMKRLEAVIWQYRNEEHFSKIPFEKIHSRIGSLLATAMEKSQDIINIKANNIPDVFSTVCSDIQWEFTKCISGLLLKKLSEPPKPRLNSLKNEKLSAMVTWMEEESCYCQWQKNIFYNPEISDDSFPKFENNCKLLIDNITKDNKLTKNDIQTVGEDDYQEVPGDMKNIFVPVKDNGEFLSETLSASAKADVLYNALTKSPISIAISIKTISTPPKTLTSDKPFAFSTPENKKKGLFSNYRQKLESDEEGNENDNKKVPETLEVIFTTPVSKKPGLYSKYREKPDSDDDDDTFLGNNRT